MLTVQRGAALYVGALIGPGLLLIPALAVQLAGPASILAWVAVLVLSAPIAVVFCALAIRYPVAGGVSVYAREAFGADVAAITGIWFVAAVVLGGPAVALVGGYYVAELTGSDDTTAVVVALVIYLAVLVTNALGITVSSAVQLLLSSVLVATILIAIVLAVPGRLTDHWSPFAPHGWWAVGTATNVLVWLVIGWEAMAQLAGQFARPRRDVPRAMTLAFVVIAVLYLGLGMASVVEPGLSTSTVPLADLIGQGLGGTGRAATAVLAVALTVGTLNVYTGSVCALIGALVSEGALPWGLVGRRDTMVASQRGAEGRDDPGDPNAPPRRPLLALAITGPLLLAVLSAGTLTTTGLVRATSACFIAVYVVALSAAARLLDGGLHVAAVIASVLAAVLAVFSAGYLAVPLVAAAACLVLRGAARRRSA
jgi:amino acid efflux transporter